METIRRQAYLDQIQKYLRKENHLYSALELRWIPAISSTANLKAIKDNYPKYVISMTPLVTRNDEEGSIHLHLRKFLREGFGKN